MSRDSMCHDAARRLKSIRYLYSRGNGKSRSGGRFPAQYRLQCFEPTPQQCRELCRTGLGDMAHMLLTQAHHITRQCVIHTAYVSTHRVIDTQLYILLITATME